MMKADRIGHPKQGIATRVEQARKDRLGFINDKVGHEAWRYPFLIIPSLGEARAVSWHDGI